MSASGLYKHFPGKEEMFTSLVKPALDGLMVLYHQIEEEYFDDFSRSGMESFFWIIGIRSPQYAGIYKGYMLAGANKMAEYM